MGKKKTRGKTNNAEANNQLDEPAVVRSVCDAPVGKESNGQAP